MTKLASASATAGRKASGRMPVSQVEEKLLEKCRLDHMHVDRIKMMSRIFLILQKDCGVRTAADLVSDDILQRFDAATAHFSISYCRALKVTLRSILNRAHEIGLVKSLPHFAPISHFLPQQRRSTPPTLEEVHQLLDYLESKAQSWSGGRLNALACTVALGGLSVGQALRLRVEDIDLSRRTIRCPGRLWMGEKLPSISHKISVDLKDVLAGWMRRTGSEWTFPNLDRSGPWVQGTKEMPIKARLALLSACRSAGIARFITFESLRRFHLENLVFDWTPRKTQGPAVQLGAIKDRPLVRGVEKDLLTPAQHKALTILLNVFPSGLSLKEMHLEYGGKGWRNILTLLRESDPDWKLAIVFPRDESSTMQLGLYSIAATN